MTEAAATVLMDRPLDGVARLRLNRPEARNALNQALRRALAEAFTELDQDESVRCVLLCGGSQCFAAGADIKEIAALGASEVWRLAVPRYWKPIAEFSKPLVAAVAGPALGGGCELALHADVIVAARSARFGQPEVTVGIMPGGGATQRLMKAVGKYRAMKLMLTGEAVGADEALAMGMVSEVVDDEALEARALELAALIAARPPMALRLLKEVALAGADAPLSTGLLLERRAFELLFDSSDQKEGMQAFAERRAPRFAGR
ncbi:putative enoyl-CoA hydratase echA8 [Variovorax sp. PBL-H6]|uniref:enoyl-CoA hydratase-related protein n=1 Tax=Variovorax sp. PBL-H6 TaxID=434009 RepID=UPI001319A730|nr:enoyl-CoA hydratase-related protein [Variovorax sp. PBL-H6]VTU21925.1 putative enoyl-CoA hydratase echA8 [Variovorax sp. PBL-H6]